MPHRAARVFALTSIFALAACSASLQNHPVAVAAVAMTDSAGRTVATADLWQEANGLVHVDVVALSLPPGDHGIHFHAVGTCTAATTPLFSSAGGHFNPLNKQHGLNNSAGPHAGDNPNLTVGANGTGKASFTTDRITLTAGTTSLFDADGSSLVIHAGPDDQMSQPAGNSGGRIACGAVKVAR
jgi:superoxide dismutase, Cu-Zn family